MVSPSGRTRLVSPSQSLKPPSPMTFSPLFSLTEVMPVQSQKALSSMRSTLPGMSTEAREAHS